MRNNSPIIKEKYDFVSFFLLGLIVCAPFFVYGVNLLIVTAVALVYYLGSLKYLIYRVEIYNDYLKIVRPFNKDPEIINNSKISEVKYMTGMHKSPPILYFKLKNKLLSINVKSYDLSLTTELIKNYSTYSFPVIINNKAKSQLKKYGIVANKEGLVLLDSEIEKITFISNYD